MDRRGFLRGGSALFAVGLVPTGTIERLQARSYREVALDASMPPDEARLIFARELDAARTRHPVYVLYYQAESPHLATYRRAIEAVLGKRGYRGTVISVDIDRHADLAGNSFFEVAGRPYAINASLSAFVDGELLQFYRTSIRAEVDGTPFSLTYPGIAGVSAGPLGDDVEKLKTRIAGFVERADRMIGAPAR